MTSQAHINTVVSDISSPISSTTGTSNGSLKPRPPLTILPRPVSLSEYECFLGVSGNVSELKEFVSSQASQAQPLLLIGERGLRQEQIARALHQAGHYNTQPFFGVNVHGLGGDALHALLFGQRGVLENCQQGTVFINDVAGLPVLLQQRFAVYLEEYRLRVWSGKTVRQRLIFATEPIGGRAPEFSRVAQGLFETLRTSSFSIRPLRERSEDIPYIAGQLIERICQRLGKGAHEIAPPAMRMLADYAWERNIDELEEVLEGAIARTPPQQIDETLLPSRVRYAALKAIPLTGIDLPTLVDDYEKTLIETALNQTGGNQTKAAKLLGLRVQTLNMKLKRFGDQKQEDAGEQE
ncbi:MAG: sigma-54-dependent transcriptional regulator [Blastocatellia bacterium]